MDVLPRFRRTINSVYRRLGREADYWPADGSPPVERVRVIARRPERLFELGEAQIHSEDPQLEFRVSEIPAPERGDDVHIGEQIYRIESEPRLEQHQLIWVVDALLL
ncbi:MAG: hypothetical protein K6L81_17550 [Agarilytica sp.]